jgi:hypothetical protein
MELILSILGAAALGHLGADFLERFTWLPDKPFKCNMCFTFWLNVIPFIFLFSWPGIFYVAVASIISELIFKYI